MFNISMPALSKETFFLFLSHEFNIPLFLNDSETCDFHLYSNILNRIQTLRVINSKWDISRVSLKVLKKQKVMQWPQSISTALCRRVGEMNVKFHTFIVSAPDWGQFRAMADLPDTASPFQIVKRRKGEKIQICSGGENIFSLCWK
jgi:hypothetical protein